MGNKDKEAEHFNAAWSTAIVDGAGDGVAYISKKKQE